MKQEVKLTVKMLAFVMALLILIVSLPVSALANVISEETSDTSTDNVSTNADIEGEPTTKDVIVLEEDEALREENIKHFKLSDGTTKAVVYSQAVHYKDADGKWVDIDNALTLNGSEYSAGNKSEIKFANKSGSSGLVSINDGGYKIDFTPLNTNKVSVKIENPQSNNSRKFEDVSVLNNLVSKAIYENIYDGIDIEYILVGNNIKENIIVKEKQDTYTFSFELKLNKLSAELVNGAILLSDYDSGEQVYKIPAPYMLDANNAYSNSVEYTLTQNSKWKYTLTVTASADWINADTTSLPVTIDPAVYVNESYIEDYTVNEEAPYTETTLSVGLGYRAYIQINTLPALPSDAYVTSAKLSMHPVVAGENYIGIYNDGEYTPEDYNIVKFTDEWYDWEFSNILKKWYSNSMNSGTLILDAMEGDYVTQFCSVDHLGGHPIVLISYIGVGGLEEYWAYASQSVGISGTGNINLASGNLIFTTPTLTTTDSLFAYAPTIVYDSAYAGESYEISDDTQAVIAQSYMGHGFKLNLNEILIEKNYTINVGSEFWSIDATYYVWIDGDGTRHTFYPSEKEEEENIYYDEDGLQCKLTVETNSITISDTSNNVRFFTKYSSSTSNEDTEVWYLSSINDKNGNKLSFTFDSSKRPTKVNVTPNGLNAIEMLTLAYDGSGRLYLVRNETSGEACLLRYSSTPTGEISAIGGAYLREVLFLHCEDTVTQSMLYAFVGDIDNTSAGITVNAIARYEYDEIGRLIKVYDASSDYFVEYSYVNDSISLIKEYGKNQVQGQSISIAYYKGYTEVRSSGSDDVLDTSDDLINVYTFDESNRTLCTYTTDSSRTKIYGAVTGEYAEQEKAKNSLAMSTVINGNSANYLLNGNFEASDSSVPNWTITGDTYLSGTSSGIAWDNARLYMYATPNGTTSISQTVKLSKGTYTLSLDINAHSSSNFQIYLKAISSNNTFIEEIPINEVYASGSGGFASFTFDVDETTATNYTVGVYLVANSSATDSDSISVDNIMLAKTTGVSQYNYVNYADLENYEIGTDLGKWNLPSGTSIDNSTLSIGNSIAIAGSIAYKRSATQTVYTASQAAIDRFTNDMTFGSGSTSEDVVFVISGFGKGIDAMNTGKSKFSIVLDITYRSVSTQFETISTSADFCAKSEGWQFTSATFVLPANSMIKEIKVRCEYSNNIGIAYFDNITLTCDKKSGTIRYLYNDDGKLKATLTGTNDVVFYTYEGNDVTNIITNKTKTTYQYDSNHNVVSEKRYNHSIAPSYNIYDSDESVDTDDEVYIEDIYGQSQVLKSTSTYTYNSYGLTVEELTYDAADTQYVKTTYLYDTVTSSKLFGALKSETNSLGNTTEYFYDNATGQLISVIESDDTGYYYTYDSIGNLTMVQPATVSTTAQPVTNSSKVQYVYNSNNRLESIIANGTTYNFAYDEFGNQESVAIGSSQIVSQETNAYNGKVTKVTYANGTIVEYTYDHLERVTEIKYTTGEAVTVYNYEYDSNGNLCKYVDGKNGTTTIYKYDISNRLVKMIEYDTEEMKNNFGVSYDYNEESRLSYLYYSQDYLYGTSAYAKLSNYYNFIYNSDNSLKRVEVNVGNAEKYRINYTYDDFRRYANKVVEFGNIDNVTAYNYLSSSNATSALISQYTTSVSNDTGTLSSQTFKYTYDETNQNITEIRDANNNLLYRYTYDSLDRLVREDNSVTNRTYLYTYDNNGNIRDEIVFVYTLGDAYDSTFVESNLWSYGNSQWGDQLTNYNGGTITYDSMGNPTGYYNGLEFTWDNVNNLVSTNDGWWINSYTYNDSGIRTSKTIYGVTHIYHLDGTRILSEEYGNKLILYIYDESGSIIGMAYRTSSYTSGVFDYYLFTKNLQGDIIGIYDTSGNCVASYTYNAWGECTVTNNTSANIGNINPFRYRGYYFDTETGFYYLNARYYDPQIKRFINADDRMLAGDVNGANLFAYCGNNPVNRTDPVGEAWWHWAIAGAIVVACAVAVVVTAGGATAGIAAVASVANGMAAATTASTVAAGAFIGSSVALGTTALIAADNSNSLEEFAEKGSWEVVANTTAGVIVGGSYGYDIAKSQLNNISNQPIEKGSIQAPKTGATPNSRYLQYDSSTNQLRSDTVYDSNGNWYSRVDYMHTHKIDGVPYMPHIHMAPPLNQNGQPIGREYVLPW
ncbi:MAG: hypothetical protein E7596_02155 [Ruminococcaceae bacterium]|nr:hypothetical protein [Oscillospiraceae bacterium]